MTKLVAGKNALVKKTGEDRYKRTLGTIFVGDSNINAKMVEDGWAWHYKQYSKDEELAKLEAKAREAKLGLWADPKPLPPWEFRQRQKEKNKPETETVESKPAEPAVKKFWLNASSNIRHNESCEHFNNTKKGRFCSESDGKACGKCGG